MSDFEDLEHHKYRAVSLAGIFYPGEDIFVRTVLDSFGLIQNPVINALCILAPHGNWNLMGNSIALAYKSLTEAHANNNTVNRRCISKVVLLGSIHSTDEEGLFISESDYFETPIGNLMIDKRINEELMSCNTLFELNDIPHLRENTTEAHFPFIKFIFPEASFIPLLVGGSKLKTMTSLASALKIVFEPIIRETLFIISSNSSLQVNPEISRMQSEEFTSLVKGKRGVELLHRLHEGRVTACGTVPMAALLESGLLNKSVVTQVPNSGGSILDVDKKTIYFNALNFS